MLPKLGLKARYRVPAYGGGQQRNPEVQSTYMSDVILSDCTFILCGEPVTFCHGMDSIIFTIKFMSINCIHIL